MKNIKDNKLYVPIQINGSSDEYVPPKGLLDRELFVSADGTLFVGKLNKESNSVETIGINALTSVKADSANVTQLVGVSNVPGSYSIKTELAGGAPGTTGCYIIFDFNKIMNNLGVSSVRVTGKFSIPSMNSIGDITYFNLVESVDDPVTFDGFTNVYSYTRYTSQVVKQPFEIDVHKQNKGQIKAGFANAAGAFIISDMKVFAEEELIWSMDDVIDENTAIDINSFTNTSTSAEFSLTATSNNNELLVMCHGTSLLSEPKIDDKNSYIQCTYTPSIITRLGNSLWGNALPGEPVDGQLFFLIPSYD